ncbi:GAF domain-containing sensor histidine kinase [Leptospira levettii]|uniref:histidine kinase n=1 Tax=Leptospira levettii TaxID=2023178 RepID=A0ABY2MT50_9LEPT|nr:ATP-binding protein [Leptospira levettii]PKA28011.1 hybrid sensor histidine kinase/response regulator [Leptospira sp. mixed culture ATI2-C-A1]TGL74727.1 GAF domain-containing sensor histidine kinase [Leptospira levettii]TGM26243.1 GAF domain-containing sensor histidine kinase [Leptospira levettii]TGM71883.1 GAF domain-containing sensor histidine kinase [Leptospira levettii]TGM88202.1 GAF domain-containing sensor histidine kinase [Leptospira levettii]
MQIAPLPKNEAARLSALKGLEILDTPEEEMFDEITKLASMICDAPISLVSLIDETRQWFKSHHGLKARETPRSLAFCSHAILGDELFVIPNAKNDKRFKNNPLVNEDPHVIFYAGIPLALDDQIKLGTLCVIDNKPRELNEEQLQMLRLLGKQTVRLLQMRKDRDKLEIEKRSAERANAAKRDFIAAISHDIRNPLNSLLGMSEMIREQPIPESIHHYVDHIKNAGEVILNLVNDTIELSRLEENASVLNNEWFHLSQCLEVYHNFFKQETKRKKIEFRLKNEISETVYLLSDKRKLEKIIWNLTANAVKFTHHGSVDCHVYLETKADENANLIIEIKDTGPGISPEIKDRLFQKYNEFVPDGCEISGSGLGLSIVKLSLEEMNGEINVESKVGEGSTFKVKIPTVWKREELSPGQKNLTNHNDSYLPQFSSRKKVLIADDNELNRKVLKNYLKPLPFDIVEANNGIETERILGSDQFDIAFLDIEMPGKHGTEIAKALSSEKTRPILFACTGLCMPEEKEHILNSGFEYFMPKPYLKEELYSHLAEIAKKHP